MESILFQSIKLFNVKAQKINKVSIALNHKHLCTKKIHCYI